jgi:cation/acetate symporter
MSGLDAQDTALALFGLIVVVTLSVTWWAARRTRTSEQFWAAGRAITPTQNGLAITGDFLSAAAFLGSTGLIFLFGFDGTIYLLFPLAAFVPVLLFYAERMRNLGTFTLNDVLLSRFRNTVIRRILAVSTLVITGLYLLAQLVAAGALFQLLAGVPFPVAVMVTSVIMLLYVTIGGMLATTWVQLIKAIALLSVLVLLIVLAIVQIRGGFGAWFAAATAPAGRINPARPGNFFGNGWNAFSTGLALIFGVIGLPHVMMRFFTVPDATSARRSATRALLFLAMATFMVITVALAARIVLSGQSGAIAASGNINVVAPLLGEMLGGGPGTVGGGIVLALVSAVAFATILAVVAGLLINASSAVVRDLWPQRGGARRAADGKGDPEVKRARIVSVVIAVVMACVTVLAGPKPYVSVLVTLALGIAASANFPALTLTLFWRRFTAAGAITGISVGLLSSAVLMLLGPTLWPGAAPSPVSLIDPTIISLPLGFAGCLVGTWLSRRRGAMEPDEDAVFDAMRRRSMLGPDDGVKPSPAVSGSDSGQLPASRNQGAG